MSNELKKWLCSCGFLLGYVEGENVVRIKRKDLYVEITNGDVKEICCRCGKTNILEYKKPSDQVDLKESRGKEENKNGL